MVMNDTDLPVGDILARLARQLRTERLNQNLTQMALAERSGISIDSVRSLEAGGNATLGVFIKVLRGLGIEDRLESVVPSAELSPIDLARRDGKVRRRASGKRSDTRSADWQFANPPQGAPPGTS